MTNSLDQEATARRSEVPEKARAEVESEGRFGTSISCDATGVTEGREKKLIGVFSFWVLRVSVWVGAQSDVC